MKKMIYRSIGAAFQRLNGRIATNQNGLSHIEITRLKVHLPRLGSQFHNYRLVQISDLHIGTWLDQTRLAGVVEMVNREKPDVVAITGDFVSFEPERFEPALVATLSQIQASDLKAAVLGNHDHWTDPAVIRRVLKRSQISDLSNSFHTLRRGDQMLHIAGVDDMIEQLDELERVLAQLPRSGTAILLAHEPDFADRSAASRRFDLQLSGHSHGGQIVLPILGPPVLPPLGRKYPSGFHRINDMVLYTNRGLGTTEVHLRINCPPEIAVIDLQSGAED